MIRIVNNRTSKKNFDTIEIDYNGERISFMGKGSLKLTSPTSDSDEKESLVNLFLPINDYFNIILDEDKQKSLFELYREASLVIEDGEFVSYEKELNKLEPIIFSILELVKPESLFGFFHHSAKYMMVPKDLKTTTGHGYYPAETTFLVNDYIELVKLVFLIRTVHPVFFGLLNRLGSLTGEEYTELVCGTLLQKMFAVTNTPGWKRLTSYVHHSFNKVSSTTASVEINNTEFTMLTIMYRIIFNRLSMAIIPEADTTGKSIVNLIASELKQYETNGYNKKESRGDDEDNSSFLDEHQITEEIPRTSINQMAEYFSFGLFDENDQPRYKNRFVHQCRGLGIKNQNLVEMVYDRLPQSWVFQKTRPMIAILQMVFARDVSESIFDVCDYVQLTSAICLAQVKLAEQGYVYLPSLLCSQVDKENKSFNSNSFLQMSSDERNYLGEICKVQSKNNEGGSFNEAVVYVKELLEEIERNNWLSNLEYGVLNEPDVYGKVTKGALFPIEIEASIKTELFRLIKEIN